MVYKQIEHTADIGLSVCGDGPEELFKEAAAGLFSLILDKGEIIEKDSWQVNINADDWETLLVQWLNELIYLFETQEALLCRFEITGLDSKNLSAKVYGENVDAERHELGMSVKAATMHGIKVEKNKQWCAQIIFDV